MCVYIYIIHIYIYIYILESACALRAHWILPSTAHSSLHLRCVYPFGCSVPRFMSSSFVFAPPLFSFHRTFISPPAIFASRKTKGSRVPTESDRSITTHQRMQRRGTDHKEKFGKTERAHAVEAKKSAPRTEKQHLKTASRS